MSSSERAWLGRQQQQRERRVGAGDDEEDVGVVQPLEQAGIRATSAPVVDRRGAEQQGRGHREDGRAEPGLAGRGEHHQDDPGGERPAGTCRRGATPQLGLDGGDVAAVESGPRSALGGGDGHDDHDNLRDRRFGALEPGQSTVVTRARAARSDSPVLRPGARGASGPRGAVTGSTVVAISEPRRLSVGLRNLVYGAYERRLAARLPAESLPRHVGVMLDGNRRWARANGANTQRGPPGGGGQHPPLLGWCEDVGVEVVTLWLLSTDNLNRPATELAPLLSIIEAAVDGPGRRGPLAAQPGRRARPAARRHRGPAQGVRRPDPRRQRACSSTSPSATAVAARSPTRCARCCRSRPPAAPRSSSWPRCSTSSTSPSTSTPRASPTRTSSSAPRGEQRLGGFLLWQSAHSEFYFCEAFWPDFRHVDFLRALRAYAERERRLRFLSGARLPGRFRLPPARRAGKVLTVPRRPTYTYDLTRGTCPAFGRPPDGAIAAPGGGPAPAPRVFWGLGPGTLACE